MFYVRNFKNFSEAQLDLDQPVTLLVGPNGSGKSNLIEAVELLSFLAAGHRLHEVTDVGREGEIEIRGGLEACAKSGLNEFTLGIKTDVAYAGNVLPTEVQYEITVRVRPEPRIIGESLEVTGPSIPVFEILPPEDDSISADNRVRYDNHSRGGRKPVELIAADRSALAQYSRFAVGNEELSETLLLIDAVASRIEAPRVFDPIPRLMRSYERQTETQLARNGYNISPVLFDLSKEKAAQTKNQPIATVFSRRDVLQRILERIAQLPDEPFTAFDFIQSKTGDVMFAFKAAGSDGIIDARLVSDGTLRALAILTALEISTPGSRMIVEELDNGVHPSRVSILAEALFECANRNKLHVLATTHNPATMNALNREQLDAVLLVVSNRGAGEARLIRLRELAGYIEFVERGRLGDLITRRVYEQHLRPDYEEGRKADIEEWINSLP